MGIRKRCHNCKFAGERFKAGTKNKDHLHCMHPQYKEGMKSGNLSAWDTLRNWWDTCDDHELKEKK